MLPNRTQEDLEILLVEDVIEELANENKIEVNEEGTEAAAATAIHSAGRGMSPPKICSFRADHPFIFLIKEKLTGNILFMGRITDPSSEGGKG